MSDSEQNGGGDSREMEDDPIVAELGSKLHQGVEELKEGDPERAINLFSFVALQARAAELPVMEASACGMLGQALLLTGRKEEGMPFAHRALEIAEELGNPEVIENFRELIAALEAPDEPEEERSEEDKILDGLNMRIKDAMEQAMAGDPQGALDALLEVAQEAQKVDALGPEASAQIGIGQLLMASGNRDLALISLNRALAIAMELENEGAVKHIRELLERTN